MAEDRGPRPLIPEFELPPPKPPPRSASQRLRDAAWGNTRALLGSAHRAFDAGQNPFLALELRRQVRRGSLLGSLLLHAMGLSVLFVLLVWITGRPWPSFLGSVEHALRLQLVVGVAALHGWLVVHASTSRVREAAQREERMWDMLVVTPLSATEIVRFKSAYPFLFSALVAAVALPIYLLAAAISGVSPGLILMLGVVYLLVSVRLVSPLRPYHPRRLRRPGRSAGTGGSLILWLWVWLWVLTWLGMLLLPLTPLAGALFLTWPVVAATILPTSYPFFRLVLPPLAVVAALGPPLFALNLRGAARRLIARITESRLLELPDRLQHGIALGVFLALLGYAWPWVIETGSLGYWLGIGRSSGASVAALGWLLLFAGWGLFAVGRILSMDRPRLQVEAGRPPGFFDGWLRAADPCSALPRAVAALVAPPLLFLGLCCLLGWRLPPLSGLVWLGHTVVVSVGAAALTGTLARRIRDATLAGRRSETAAAWSLVLILLVAPLALLLRPAPGTIRAAALSPFFGFLVVLPRRSFLSPTALGPLPPWWLSPLLATAAALLVARLRPVRAGTGGPSAAPAPRAAVRPRQRSSLGPVGLWVLHFAERTDNPVLLKELRVSARRGGGLRGSGRLSLGAAAALGALLPALLLLYDTSLGAYAPGGIPLRDYLSVVTGLAGSIPVRLFPPELSGFRLFYASAMALLLSVLGLVVPFTAPALGAATFAPERRSGTLGFLLLTPLSEAEILRGKLLAAATPLLLALALIFPTAAAAALLSFSLAAVGALLVTYVWLLVDGLTGTALGMLATLLLPGESEPMFPPLLAMFLLQALKLYAVGRLQWAITGATWPQTPLPVLAWYVVPLVLVEAGSGWLAYRAGLNALARTRRHDHSARFSSERLNHSWVSQRPNRQ